MPRAASRVRAAIVARSSSPLWASSLRPRRRRRHPARARQAATSARSCIPAVHAESAARSSRSVRRRGPVSGARTARTPPRRPNRPRAPRRARPLPPAARRSSSPGARWSRRDARRSGPRPSRGGLGGSTVRRTPLARRRAGVHRRAQERMPELDAPAANRDQAPVLGLAEARDIESESSAHVGDETEVRTAHGGDEQDCPAARRPGRSSRRPNASITARGTRSGSPVSRLSITSRSAARSSSSASGLPAVARCSRRTSPRRRDAGPPAMSVPRRLEIQPADRQRRQPRRRRASPSGLRHPEQHDNRVCRQPPRGEDQGARRRTRRPGAGRRRPRRPGRPRHTGRPGSERLRRS